MSEEEYIEIIIDGKERMGMSCIAFDLSEYIKRSIKKSKLDAEKVQK